MADPTYYVSTVASVVGASKRHLAIWNGHASLLVHIYSIRVAGAPTVAVAGLVIPLTILRISSAPTGGSAVTATKSDSNNANVPATITFTIGATGGATEAGAVGCGVVSGEETSFTNSDSLLDCPIDGSQPLTLRPGEGIVIRQGALASAGAITIIARIGII